MADDGTEQDEVKVFRRNDAEDLETTAQSSHQLAEDKKEVVLETELESRPADSIIGSKPGAFVKPMPSPSFSGMPAAGSFSPNWFMMPWIQQIAQNPSYNVLRPQMSPSFMFMPSMGPMSPSLDAAMMYNRLMMNSGAGSPLYASLAANNPAMRMDSVPLPANMRIGNPLNQINQMRVPYSPMASMASNLANDGLKGTRGGRVKKEDHIKKPLNAFMWFMKENRPKLMEEGGHKEKQSAELNKELGKRWHSLSKAEQNKYFDMAKQDRDQHKEKYPQWSARENYAIHKRKKRKRDKSVESGESKKCRARFGVNQQTLWCKFCKRKKKCEYSYDRGGGGSDGGLSVDLGDRASSGPSPMASSMGPSPLGPSPMENNVSDSESDMEEDDNDMHDDRTFIQQDLQEAASQHQPILTL